MRTPRIYVDFNEMASKTEVLLSQGDAVTDSDGNVVSLSEGMELAVYSHDIDDDGKQDNLIAEGIAVRNHHGGWTAAALWLLRINDQGIRHQSDVRDAE